MPRSGFDGVLLAIKQVGVQDIGRPGRKAMNRQGPFIEPFSLLVQFRSMPQMAAPTTYMIRSANAR